MTKLNKTGTPNTSHPPRNSDLESSRETLQNKLEFFRHRFHQVFENVNDGIIIHDTEGHIFDVNSPMSDRLGYTKEELLAMNLNELAPPEFGRKIAERTLRLKRNGTAVFESADLRKDGRPMYIEVSARLFLENGKPLIQSVVRDITDRKTAEELITAAMEDKESALEDMRAYGKLITEVMTGILRPSEYLSDSMILEQARRHMKTMAFIQTMILETPRPSKISSSRLIGKLLIHLSKQHWKRMTAVSLHPEITEMRISSCASMVLGLLLSEMFVLVLDSIPFEEPGWIFINFNCPDTSQGQLTLKIKRKNSSSPVSLIRQDDPLLKLPLMLSDLLPGPSLQIEADGVQIQFEL
jgi:PAS domain S-box-containing protein